MKHVDLEKPTTLLGQVHVGCTHRECFPNNSLLDEYRKMFESRISEGAPERLLDAGKVDTAWSNDLEGHAKTCVEPHCEFGKQKRRAVV